jgi:ACS family hexuronate transporter-like MFS transporter
MTNARASTVPKYRYVMLGMLFFAAMMNYVDRATLPIVAPLVAKELHFAPAEMGVIFSTFFIGYAAFCFIGGAFADRFGAKRVYGYAMAIWSAFCGMTVVATGFTSLLIYRVIFGMGEGPMGSITNKVVRNWFPRHEVGRVLAVAPNIGNQFGAFVAGPLVGLLVTAGTWRTPFIVVTIVGFVWVVLWVRLAADTPAESPYVSDRERVVIESGQSASAASAATDAESLGHYLVQPTVLAVGAGFFGANYITYYIATWLPSYLMDVHHLPLRSAAMLVAIPPLMGVIGNLIAGTATDMMLRWTGQAILSRKIILIMGLVVSASSLGAVTWIDSVNSALVMIATAQLFIAFVSLNCWLLVQDLVPPSRVGGVGGFVHLLANLSGIIGPAVTGFIIQYGGGYSLSFLVAGGVPVLAALAVLMFVRTPTRVARAEA